MNRIDHCLDDHRRTVGSCRLSRRTALIQGTAGLATGALGASAMSAAVQAQEASPAAVATNPSFAATLEPMLLETMEQMRIPGAIVFVDDPARGTWTTALGTANLATGESMQAANYHRIGSLTKTFTATAILQLVDQGLIQLEDPVSTYHPLVPNGDNITIRQLLDMSSGIASYDADEVWVEAYLSDPYQAWSPEELIAVGVQMPPTFAPGEGWGYSNTNTILLGMIVEQITNEPLADVFQRTIFEPLGMNQTSLPPLSSSAIPDHHAQGYMYGLDFDGTGALIDTTDWSPSWGWAAGSMISTLQDLRIWAKALATGELLSEAAQEERLGWVDTGSRWLDSPFLYGLGLINFGGFLGHSGVIFGYTSWMGHQPETGATIIVLTNLYLAEGAVPPAATLALAINRELFP